MTRKGVWNLQQVRDKYLQSLWDNSTELWGWGMNSGGNLAQNTSSGDGYSSPIQITGSWDKIGVFVQNTTHAIKEDGTLWGWGNNSGGDDNGKIGDNTTVNRSSPTQIPGTTWKSTAGGKEWTIGSKTDGTLWGWGTNFRGALGLNQAHNTKISSPTQIPGTTWDKACGGAYEFSLATKTDGTLWSWGYNYGGALGQNNNTAYSSPVQIPGTTWNSVSNDGFSALASKTDGTLWSWGYNSNGGLGHNNRTFYSSPTQIPGTTWNQVSRSYYCGFATRTDGTLWAWGKNNEAEAGLLGQNNQTKYSSPVQIPGSWSKIAVGRMMMSAIKTDGTLWQWGRNLYGSIGINYMANAFYSSPVQVGSDTTWDSVESTAYNTFATKKPLTPSQL